MPLTVPCRKCKKKFVVRSKYAGRAVTCTACGHIMRLPPLKRILAKHPGDAARSKSVPTVEPIVELELTSDDLLPDDEESTATDLHPVLSAAPAEPTTVACPHCGGPLFYEPLLAEQVVACPYCAGHLQMPRL